MNVNVDFLKFKLSDVFARSIVTMSDKFKVWVKNVYQQDCIWQPILKALEQNSVKDEMEFVL